MKKISATKARNDFFNILGKGYLKKEKYIIYKSGIPLMVLSPYKEPSSAKKAKFNAEELLKAIKENKKDMKMISDSVEILRNLRLKNAY